ncbi:hypothetical protein A9W97_10920 [Mycobacterium gordonae]|nr:hypothetical protein [Mycobacterium gordonae]OBJ92030.1 hypothetical protein A9W97_10920 [Mycobacterium gordonae]
MVVPLELATQLVGQHRVAVAKLHGEICVAFDATVARWYSVFPDPMQIPGGTLCSDVRAHVLAMNGINAQTVKGSAPPRAPVGASCGPGSTLRMSTAASSSVRIGDSGMAWARVRHMSPKDAAGLDGLVPELMPSPRPYRQMALDGGEPEDQRVLGPAGIGEDFDLVVYWWETPGRLSVGGAILAVMDDLDGNEERILAFAPLPAAIRPSTVAELQHNVGDDDEDERVREDFNRFLPGKPAFEAGEAEA